MQATCDRAITSGAPSPVIGAGMPGASSRCMKPNLFLSPVIWMAIACGPTATGGSGDAAGSNVGDDGGSNAGDAVNVYAHTAQVLYRIDPETLAVTKVAAFGWPAAV